MRFLSAKDRDRCLQSLVCNAPCRGYLEVLPPQTTFVLKGSGFYQNDYGKKN
jgi:predicted nucleic acid-binding Zn ribbon protein